MVRTAILIRMPCVNNVNNGQLYVRLSSICCRWTCAKSKRLLMRWAYQRNDFRSACCPGPNSAVAAGASFSQQQERRRNTDQKETGETRTRAGSAANQSTSPGRKVGIGSVTGRNCRSRWLDPLGHGGVMIFEPSGGFNPLGNLRSPGPSKT